MDGPIGGDLGYFKYAIFVGDNRTFSVTAGVPTEDDELRRLLHSDAFDQTLRMMPATEAWVDPDRAEPTDEVAVMAGLRNQRRRLVAAGAPVALGLHAIGDASVCTNPLYGRGCSLGMVHARLCADTLEAHGWATPEATLELDALTEKELGPWYRASVDADRADIASRVEGVQPGGFQELLRDGFMPAARTDPEVFRVFLRSFNLLDHPAAMLQRPDLLAKINEAYAQRHDRETPPAPGPPRDELIAALRGRGARL
jgi:flavin-dependent dehydrogenase